MPAHQTGPDAVTLDRAVPVHSLPGFDQGEVSVQDAGAQWAARLLDAHRAAGARRCAAPGGKSGHILERRMSTVRARCRRRAAGAGAENLDRLQLQATLLAGDAAQPAAWWDGRPFDRSWPTCRAAPPAWCAAIPTQVAAPPGDIAQLPRSRPLCWRHSAAAGPRWYIAYVTCSDSMKKTTAGAGVPGAPYRRRRTRPLPQPLTDGALLPMPSTMVSFTPCCARRDPAFRWLAACCWAAGWPSRAVRWRATKPVKQAASAPPSKAICWKRRRHRAQPHLEDALSKGINLYFLLELELTRPRNWWLDEDIAEVVRKLRIYYHLLLRRYVVEIGYTTRTVATLGEALTLLGRVDDWQVLERGALKTGRRYDARLRLRLDTTQLPKPLSIGAVTSDKWELATPWYGWSFEAPAAPASSPSLP